MSPFAASGFSELCDSKIAQPAARSIAQHSGECVSLFSAPSRPKHSGALQRGEDFSLGGEDYGAAGLGRFHDAGFFQ